MKKRFVGVYASLLDCLPPGFRNEFSEEMEQVFAGRMQEAGLHKHSGMVRLFISELLALPGLWLLAYQRDRRVIKVNDSRTITTTDGPASWGAALAAALPLAGYIGFLVMAGTLDRFLSAAHLDVLFHVLWTDVIRGAPFPVIFYLLLLGGFLIAWLKGFPRWSYPYLGWLLIIIISGMGIFPGLSAPYLRQMGIVGLNDPYLRRIWGPFLVMLLIAILLNHSRKPLKALWHGLRKDWTLASFAMFAILGFSYGNFDEVPGMEASQVYWQLFTSAVLVVGVLWYMRANGKAGRIAALLASATLSMALSTGVSAYYWQNFPKSYGPLISGYDDVLVPGLVVMAVVVVFLLAPALFSAALNRLFPNHLTG